jgi:Protein of unknown function (DUF1572)
MSDQILGAHFLEDALKSFRDYKKLAEGAFAQVDEADLFRTIDEESNSIAVNMKHMAGNMLSRWTDFLTTDGEKPNRERDMEFVMLPSTTKAEMLAYWEQGWQSVFDAIEPLTAGDLMRIVKIRGQDHTVVQAINRQIAHYSYHVGQIVYLAKHFKSSAWQTLSVPKNKSAEFNKYLEEKTKSGTSSTEGRFDAVTEFAAKNR